MRFTLAATQLNKCGHVHGNDMCENLLGALFSPSNVLVFCVCVSESRIQCSRKFLQYLCKFCAATCDNPHTSARLQVSNIPSWMTSTQHFVRSPALCSDVDNVVSYRSECVWGALQIRLRVYALWNMLYARFCRDRDSEISSQALICALRVARLILCCTLHTTLVRRLNGMARESIHARAVRWNETFVFRCRRTGRTIPTHSSEYSA